MLSASIWADMESRWGQWRRARAEKLQQNPVCENPLAITDHADKAREVHHKRAPDCRSPELLVDEGNLVSVCVSCYYLVRSGATRAPRPPVEQPPPEPEYDGDAQSLLTF